MIEFTDKEIDKLTQQIVEALDPKIMRCSVYFKQHLKLPLENHPDITIDIDARVRREATMGGVTRPDVYFTSEIGFAGKNFGHSSYGDYHQLLSYDGIRKTITPSLEKLVTVWNGLEKGEIVNFGLGGLTGAIEAAELQRDLSIYIQTGKNPAITPSKTLSRPEINLDRSSTFER